MKKGLLITSLAFMAMPLIGCDKTSAPKSVTIYGADAAMMNTYYQFVVGVEGDDNVNPNVIWSVDNTDVATIDETGLLNTKEIDKNTEITITATSKKDNKIKNEKKITVFPGEPLTRLDFIAELINQETIRYEKHKSQPTTIECTCKEDDSYRYLKKDFKIKDPKFIVEEHVAEQRVTGCLAFIATDETANTKIAKTIDFGEHEYVNGLLQELATMELNGEALYNCFSYSSTGTGDHDCVGYYSYIFDVLTGNYEFDYYLYSGGYMCDAIKVKNNITYYSLHFTPKAK